MPTISIFRGVKIAMFYNDHNPPHFHAASGEREATFVIATGDVLDGSLPRKDMKSVMEWYGLHRNELQANWDLARANAPLNRIPPLP